MNLSKMSLEKSALIPTALLEIFLIPIATGASSFIVMDLAQIILEY
jgi:hypothetical protein